jgi:hypothetical protein
VPTAFLIAWAIATVALAAYLIHADRRDEARRRARAAESGDVRPFRERSRRLALVEGVVAPICLAVIISFLIGGSLGVAYKVLNS